MKRFTQALVVLSALALCVQARAVELQKPGNPQVWPGKWMIGFHPIGVEASLDGYSAGGFKVSLDIAYRVKETSKLSIWVGGLMSYGHPTYSCPNLYSGPDLNDLGCAQQIEISLFVRLTLEKLITKLPLVPYVQIGAGADVLDYYRAAGTNIGTGIPIRLGGGVHYWILKNLGLGVETNVGVGPGLYPQGNAGSTLNFCNRGQGATCALFFGYWDFLLGARAAF